MSGVTGFHSWGPAFQVAPIQSHQCVLESCLKILIYALNYAPELTGVGKYTGEMAAWLGARGHQVRVVTALPYYPQWRIHEKYRGSLYRVERNSDATIPRVYRCPLWVPARPGGFARLLHLSSFAMSSAPVMALQTFWRPDVVFAVQPTFFAAPLALLSATVSGAASWLHVQDFEVDAAFRMKLLPKLGKIEAVAKGIESLLTRCFSRVSSISNKMVEGITARGGMPGEVVLFPNWGDVDLVRPALPGTANRYREEYGLASKIIFLYAGNMGVKQGLNMLAPLVESFSSDSRVHFLFCGDGVYRKVLKEQVGHCSNVTLLPLQPENQMNELLNAADIHLLPQKPGAADLVMPSKLCGMFASGRPVIATADEGTQVANVVAGCGLVVPSGDSEALCAAALQLIDHPEMRASLGSAARDYAVKHLRKELVLEQFELDMLSMLTPPVTSEKVQLATS